MKPILLVSLRDPDDPMALHELSCFAQRCDISVEQIDLWFVQKSLPNLENLRERQAILFGGSGAYSVLDPVEWIQKGIRLCLDVVDLGIPAYASCFGFQGLARALGGVVVRDDRRTEIGATWLELTKAGEEDSLFSCLPREFSAQEGHHDHVVELPPGVELLATGKISPYQAFRVSGAPFWASQFHPELTATTASDRYRHYLSHYAEPGSNALEKLAELEAGFDSPEIGLLLSRLVRHDF